MLRLQVILPVAQVCVFWNFLSTPQYIVCHYLGRKLWLSQSLRFQVLATLISHSKYRYFTVILLLERKLWPSQSLRLQQSVLYLELFCVFSLIHWWRIFKSSARFDRTNTLRNMSKALHSGECVSCMAPCLTKGGATFDLLTSQAQLWFLGVRFIFINRIRPGRTQVVQDELVNHG